MKLEELEELEIDIVTLYHNSKIELGKKLTLAKTKLPRGKFCKWIKTLGMTPRIAQYYMKTFRTNRFAGDYTLGNKRHGCVYFIELDSKYIRIGRTKGLTSRLKQHQKNYPNCQLIASIESTDAPYLENLLHTKYKAFNIEGEVFRLSPIQLAEAIGFAKNNEHDHSNSIA